jgi:large subunit ribosomal protein L9
VKVVLRVDNESLGKKGDILDVADGYARNYLIPRGHAIKATAGIENQAKAMRRSRDVRDAQEREGAEAIARELVARQINVTGRAGSEGRLFGSVTAVDLATAIQEQTGLEVDRRKIHIDEPIRSVGSHEVLVRLHADVEFRVTVEVAPST